MSKKRIMLVDDTPLIRFVVRSLIDQTDDLEVVATAVNGKDALNKLDEAKPDLILTDIEMPEMDGLTFLRHLRLRSRAKTIVLSSIATAGSDKALEARKLGANAVIAKLDGAAVISNDTSGHVVDTIRQVLGMARAS